jgi:hypothetical protein
MENEKTGVYFLSFRFGKNSFHRIPGFSCIVQYDSPVGVFVIKSWDTS